MTPLEAIRSALDSLRGHPLRSVLTMLGMIFGVAAVIAMLAIGAGAEQQALAMIERLGANNVLVRDVELEDNAKEEARQTSPGVSPRDMVAVLDAVPGIETVAARATISPYQVVAGARTTQATLHGVSWETGQLSHLAVAEGRFLDALDERTHAQVAVIGERVRRELFGWQPVLGARLKVDDLWLEVIGVLAPSPAATDVHGVAVGSTASEIYMPIATVLRKLDRPPLDAPLDELVLRLSAGTDPREAARQVEALLGRLHGSVKDFEIVVPEALLEQSRRTQRLFSLVMGCIAGISLLVGGIGIMNIMLATVLERTREIGVRRAVGARQRDIRDLFLVESFAISVLGGLVGVVLGVMVAKIVAASAGWPTVVTLFSVALSFSVSLAVGLGSGLYPAMRAAHLDPIEAIRHE